MRIKKVKFILPATISERSIAKDLILPILVWVGLILVFLNVKHLPFEFSDKGNIVLRQFAKVLMTILLPLAIIRFLYKDRRSFGTSFPNYSSSFQLSLKAFSRLGPACMAFLLIAIPGWSFGDWPGAITLSVAFLIASYFVPSVTQNLVTKASQATSNKRISPFVFLSLFTLIVTYLTIDHNRIISNIFYYVFIVGFGEEVFFRGYIQSSLNRYFGKSFIIGNVTFGWGLIVAAALFGLSHALVTVPPTWPWAVWTFIMGLSLGFIREKDGSILAAVLLHAMIDFPLVFIS